MKIFRYFTISFLLLFPIILVPTITVISSSELGTADLILFADNDVSDYEVNQSVTYEVDIDYEFTNLGAKWNYIFRAVRYPDRQPDNPLSEFTPEYQEINLLENTILGNTTPITVDYDKFNNTFDFFNATLETNENVTFHQTYEVKLNEIYFDVGEDDIGSYNSTDVIQKLYCNVEEEFFNRSDPNLISLSNSIVDSGDNPIEKAEDINDWISENIDYKAQNDEMGASWAYTYEKGDCSEFADLMVTLLRIQDIPARKITGMVITNDPTEIPEKGDEYTYTNDDPITDPDDDLLGHAWMEYYVPNIGWIVCDPTWDQAGLDYFNRIDFFHFGTTVGAYFLIPGTSLTVSEYNFIPSPFALPGSSSKYTCDVTFTVTETDFKEPEEENIWELIIKIIIICAISAAIAAIIIVVVRYERKKARKKVESS